MKTGKIAKIVFAVLTGLFGVLLCVSVVGFQFLLANNGLINSALGTSDSVFVETDPGSDEDTAYFKSDYSSYEELRKHEDALSMTLQEEGTVLLKNNGALPMKKQAKVTLLSQSSVNLVYNGKAAAVEGCVTMKEALESGGFVVNGVMYDFYTSSGYARVTGGQKDTSMAWKLGEVPLNEYTDEAIASCDEYNDAAFVVLSRSGGEGADLPTGVFGDGDVYLALQETEKDLLRFANEHFDTVIVLLNTQNAMEIGFIDEAEYGVDACVWIGPSGSTGVGLNALPGLLTGDAVPSGHLVDTYSASSLSSASVQNSGEHFYSNWEEKLVAQMEDRGDGNPARNGTWKVDGPYVAYTEGIYVGYRYYETRYEDSVLGRYNATGSAGTFASTGDSWNYAEEVVFPFGYGMTYTTFSQTLDDVRDLGDRFAVTVTVTNTGDVYTAKDVVQVYAQSEYTDYDRANGVEKSALNLVGFAKTKAIGPHEADTVTMEIDKRDLATYDEHGHGTYIMEAGDYYLSVGTDAHNAVNNILAAKGCKMSDGMDENGDASMTYRWQVRETDTETYSVSSTGYEISNRFDKSELSDYGYDISVLTRKDWNTFPTEVADIAASDELAYDTLTSDGDNWEASGDDGSDIVVGADTEYKLIALRGKSYSDDAWRLLLNQLTVDDMMNLIGNGGYGTPSVDSVAKPPAVDKDGPNGFKGEIDGIATIQYQPSIVFSSTWNTELLNDLGKCVAEDGLRLGISGWYAPAVNLHRTPYSGRNFEYLSEDGFLSGKIASAQILGAQEKGLYVFVKHFALNDMETQRHGISVFASEQTIREVYLPAFRIAVEEGDAHGIMSSFNRIGATWTGAHYGLLTEVLRNEWGFRGMVVTDAANSIYMDVGRGVLAGNDLWLTVRMDAVSNLAIRNPAKDGALLSAMRESCHRILYAVVNSNAMNGVSTTMIAVPQLPWWKVAMIWANIVFGVFFLGSLVALVLTADKRIREKCKGGNVA